MKKYLIRLIYILILLYVPGVILGLLRMYHYDMGLGLTWENFITNTLPPGNWFLDAWPRQLGWIFVSPILYVPIYAPVFWAIYRWFKKPSVLIALFLLFCSIILNPLLAPHQRLLFFLGGGRPLLQPLF